jgi:hypothetical protein
LALSGGPFVTLEPVGLASLAFSLSLVRECLEVSTSSLDLGAP